jgi:hypothetical protein
LPCKKFNWVSGFARVGIRQQGWDVVALTA